MKKLFKDLRDENQLTQLQMGEMLSVDQGYISRVEAGLCNPSFKMLCRVKERFNKSWEDLEVYFENEHHCI